VILRAVGKELERYANELVAFPGSPAAAHGRFLLEALAELKVSARELREERALQARALDGMEDVVWLSTRDAAADAGVSVRQIVHYIDGGNGPLPATRVGERRWKIRADDLADFRYSRSEVAG
jgi:hypothetical protein